MTHLYDRNFTELKLQLPLKWYHERILPRVWVHDQQELLNLYLLISCIIFFFLLILVSRILKLLTRSYLVKKKTTHDWLRNYYYQCQTISKQSNSWMRRLENDFKSWKNTEEFKSLPKNPIRLPVPGTKILGIKRDFKSCQNSTGSSSLIMF